MLSPRIDLPLAELSAARLDGELFALDECFSVCDLPVGRVERAHAVAAVIPRRGIADRLSAAWVHGAREDPPAVHSVAVDARDRSYVPFSQRYTFREVVLGPEDVQLIGGHPVTTPLRTLADLARTAEAWSPRDAPMLRALADAAGTSAAVCLAYLAAAPRLPGKRVAAARIREALSPR